MTIRVRFSGGVLDGLTDDMAPDETIARSPMFIGGHSEDPMVQVNDRYEVGDAPDEHGVYVFTKTGQYPAESHGDGA